MNVMEHGRKMLALILGAMLSAALAGCMPDHPPQNIQPGNKAYPLSNPTSTKSLRFVAIIAPTLHLRFRAKYTAFARHPLDVPAECRYSIGPGSRIADSVSVPIEVKFEKEDRYQGRYYQGEIVVDRYLPGHCQWGLAGGVFEIEGGTSPEFPFFEYVSPGDYGTGSVGPCVYVCTGTSLALHTRGRESESLVVGCAARGEFTNDRSSILAMARRYGANGPSCPVGDAVETYTAAFQDLENPLPPEPYPIS